LLVSLPRALLMVLALVLFKISAFVPLVNDKTNLASPPTSSRLSPAMVTRSAWPSGPHSGGNGWGTFDL
jgi:hypothetical protein